MNESELDDKIRNLTPLQKVRYPEYLFKEVGGYDDYYDGIYFSEAAKMCFATFEQKLKAYDLTLGKK